MSILKQIVWEFENGIEILVGQANLELLIESIISMF